MPLLFSYLGPDVLVPLASIVAAIVGFLLAMGKLPLHFAAKMLRKIGIMKPLDESLTDETESKAEEDEQVQGE